MKTFASECAGAPFARVLLAGAEDGWATFTVAALGDFPLRPGYSVQFFPRARKEGENALAGVSTRRLVQVATARGA